MQNKLIGIRKGKLITQQQMADALDIDLRTYQAKERGESQFKLNEMFGIAQLFNMKIDDIFLPDNFTIHEVKLKNKQGV